MAKLLVAASLLLVSSARLMDAQAFQGLSTTDDGLALYFASPVRPVGTNLTFHSKIYRWTSAGGVIVQAEVTDEGTSDGCTTPSFYQLTAPQVSGDGATLAYTASRPAQVSRYCTPVETNEGLVQRQWWQFTAAGNVTLTPNGKYAITTPLDAVTSGYHRVTGLASGVTTTVAGAFNGAAQRVTNDGTIITPEPKAIILTDRQGGTRVVTTKNAVADCIIDPGGTTLVYQTMLGPGNNGMISVISLATGTETTIFQGLGPSNLGITADASLVIFTNNAPYVQLFVAGIAGGAPRQITHEPDGISSAVISGDGRTAFATSAGSRLIRIDTTSGVSTELISATPLIESAYRIYLPKTTVAALGSVIDLYGYGLASVQQVNFCGRSLAAASPHSRFQVPWDLPEGACPAIVSAGSGFEDAIALTVQTYDPQFIAGGLLFHGDFSGMVSSSHPALPGEIISAYMTGLGPVDAAGGLAAGFQCTVGSVSAEVLYAGLAPGVTGFYQINVRIPSSLSSDASIACGFDVLRRATASIWIGPPKH